MREHESLELVESMTNGNPNPTVRDSTTPLSARSIQRHRPRGYVDWRRSTTCDHRQRERPNLARVPCNPPVHDALQFGIADERRIIESEDIRRLAQPSPWSHISQQPQPLVHNLP